MQRQFTLLHFPEGTLFNRVNVLIRGDLPTVAAFIAKGAGLRAIPKGVGLPPNPTVIMAAHHAVTQGVSGRKSAEAIVAKRPG